MDFYLNCQDRTVGYCVVMLVKRGVEGIGVISYSNNDNSLLGAQMKLAGNINSQYILQNPSDVAQFIESSSVDFVDEESILNYVDGCEAVLVVMDISKISTGDANHHIENKLRQKEYNNLSIEGMPPIVIDEAGIIIDGHHRYRAAVFNGATHMVVYQLQLIGLHLC